MAEKDTRNTNDIAINAASIAVNTNITTGSRPIKRRVVSIENDRFYNSNMASTTAQSGGSSGYNSLIENEILMSKKLEDPYMFLLRQLQKQQQLQQQKKKKKRLRSDDDFDKNRYLYIEETFHGNKPLRESRVNAIQRGIKASKELFGNIYSVEDLDDNQDNEKKEGDYYDGICCEDLVLGIPGMSKSEMKGWMKAFDNEFNHGPKVSTRKHGKNKQVVEEDFKNSYFLKKNSCDEFTNVGSFNGRKTVDEVVKKIFNRIGSDDAAKLNRSEIAYFAGMQRELDHLLLDIRKEDEEQRKNHNEAAEPWEQVLIGKMRFKS